MKSAERIKYFYEIVISENQIERFAEQCQIERFAEQWVMLWLFLRQPSILPA